ncbi:MAG: hypothetical protein ABI175_25295 [Polyangiales bacterium]
MRKLPSVLAISVAVHTALLAWVNAYSKGRPDPVIAPPTTTVEILDVPPALPPVVDVAPVDVAFLDEAASAAIPELVAPTVTPRRARDRGEEIATGRPSTEVAAATGPVVRNPYMDMRRPGAPKVALPRFEWDPDMAPGPPPPEDPTTGQLRDSGNGTHKSDQGAFVAKVGRDGSVKLKDKKNFNIRFALPSPKQLGRMVGDWYEDPNKPVGTLPPDHIERGPVLGTDESSSADKKADHGDVGVPIVAGGFDLSDAFMRNHGQDPYASKKLKFLDSTRDERVQIGLKHRNEQLAKASEIMRGNLEQVWRSVADPAARREALFELWDESADTGSEQLVAAGEQARSLVIGWIRARLPAGSPVAYGTDELARLNAKRTSKAPFAPY